MNRKQRRRQNKVRQSTAGRTGARTFSAPPTGGVSSSLMNYAMGESGKAEVPIVPSLADGLPRAASLMNAGQLREASEICKPLLIFYPKDPDLNHLAGLIAMHEGNTNEAKSFLQAAVDVAPDYTEAHANLATLLYQTGDISGAELSYRRAINLKPDFSDALYNMANLLLHTDRFEEAVVVFEEGIRVSPDQPWFYLGLSYAAHALADTEKALINAELALTLDPTDAAALVQKAVLFSEKDDIAGAETLYRKAIELDPSYADAYAKLGLLLANNMRYDAAKEPLQRAIGLIPDDARLKFSLGATLRSENDFDGAVPLYQEALALDPSYAAGFWEMGHALETIGRVDEAIEAYENCLTRDPANAVARHLLSALKGETTESAPAEYVEELFDDYASTFDESLLGELDYQSPARIRELMEELPGAPFASGLDLGCGTGLIAEAIGHLVQRFIGVDISRKMLNEADRKGCYAALHHQELVEYLNDPEFQDGLFDIAIAGDVLTYMGNLAPIFSGVYRRLNAGGWFLFTVESLTGEEPHKLPNEGYMLRPSGRYAHSEKYLRTAIAGTGLEISLLRTTVLRTDEGEPINGFLILAVRP